MLRRRFMVIFTAVFSSMVALLLAIPCVRFLFAPLNRHHKPAEFQRVAPLTSLPEGTPTRITITADRQDAFTHYPKSAIGSVWLRRRHNAAGLDEVDVWQTICPHLGCGIERAADDGFTCRCHASDFDANGQCLSGPSPRGMDKLEVRLTSAEENEQVWVEVRYQQFELGTSLQRAKS